jgi:RHS repeat-associated protein
VQSGGSTVVTYAYDKVGRNTQKTFGNGVTTTQTYDIEGRLTKSGTANAGGLIQVSVYALDNRDNRTGEASAGLTAVYTYDALSRLTKAVYAFQPSSGSPVVDHTYIYSYDAVGNRTNAIVDGVSTNYIYDVANHMTSAGGMTVTYDGAGRITNDGRTLYGYDAFDHLTYSMGSVAATYRYDGDDNRVGETVSGASSTFLLDTVAPLPQRIASTTSAGLTRYVYGLERAQDVAPSGSVSYEHVDGLGSVRMITNAAGSPTAYYWYTPTGAPLAGSGPFGFTGEPYEAGGSLVYLRARDYSPSLDRFLTMDPHDPSPIDPITYNPYLYAANNPVNMTDHSGQCFIEGPPCNYGPSSTYISPIAAWLGVGQSPSYSYMSPFAYQGPTLMQSMGEPVGSYGSSGPFADLGSLVTGLNLTPGIHLNPVPDGGGDFQTHVNYSSPIAFASSLPGVLSPAGLQQQTNLDMQMYQNLNQYQNRYLTNYQRNPIGMAQANSQIPFLEKIYESLYGKLN